MIYGGKFTLAAPLLARLIFGTLALTQIAVTAAIFTAAGKPRWTVLFTGPLVPLAAAGYLWLVPRLGGIGAATHRLFGSRSVGVDGRVYKLWGVAPSAMSWLRSVVLCGAAYALAANWPAPGLFPLLKLPLLSVLTVAGYAVLGEFTAREIAGVRSLLPERRISR